MSSFLFFSESLVVFQGYRKLIENTAKKQLNSAGAIESAPWVYNNSKNT